jgi:hypothetical protein
MDMFLREAGQITALALITKNITFEPWDDEVSAAQMEPC